MLTPPPGLSPHLLAGALDRHWGIRGRPEYRPLGWGSHHYDVAGEWFVAVDELEVKRHTRNEPLEAPYRRLCSSLAAARELADRGYGFVVAPVPTRAGSPVARLDERFAVAVYPFVAGQSFPWSGFTSAGHRDAALALVVAVHAATGIAADTDDFAIPHRDDLDAALHTARTGSAARPAGSHPANSGGSTGSHPVSSGGDSDDGCGPYGRPVLALLAEHATGVEALLARYENATARIRPPARVVLTHGEPHPANLMLAGDGWRLIDWDTALLAPPERDLWLLDPGDGSVLAAYSRATGVRPQPEMLDLYRLRWDIADLAMGVSRFRRPHDGNVEDRQYWELLRTQLSTLPADR